MNENSIRRRIYAYDFSILEFELYLDTHPEDKIALEKHRALIAERNNLIKNYEKRFGKYTVNSQQVIGNTWSWINNPWPWEYTEKGDI